MINQIEATSVPKYRELFTKKIWEMVQQLDELMEYFPDYLDDKLFYKNFMFSKNFNYVSADLDRGSEGCKEK